jgi:DNA-binding response OmpR family regulator
MSRYQVLVAEDETLLALEIADALTSCASCEIAISTTIDQAYKDLQGPLDFAVLDIRLIGGQTFEIAEILRTRGVPCVFLTGAERTEVPESLRDVPFLQKPFDLAKLKRFLFAALRDARARRADA